MTETQWEHDMAAPDFPESYSVVGDGPPAPDTLTPDQDNPPADEPDDIIAAEYRGLVLDGLRGDIQSDRDVEIILKRVRWHKRRIKDVEARLATEVAAIRTTAEIEITALTENAEGVLKDNRNSLAWYEATFWPRMREWLTAFLAETGTDKKSVKTIFGRIGLVAPGKPKTVIEDHAKALAWCKAHCTAAIKQEILVSKLPEGKAVPGIKQIPGQERFEVETN